MRRSSDFSHHGHSDDDVLETSLNAFVIPVLPKSGILLNLTGCVIISLIIMGASTLNGLSGSKVIYHFSYLIPLYLVGVICGIVSAICGFFHFCAHELKQLQSTNRFLLSSHPLMKKYSLHAAVFLMVSSNIVFFCSSIYGMLQIEV